MAISIDATVAGEDSNCYVTLIAAEAYFADTLRETTWEAWSDEAKSQALIQTTQQIGGLRLKGTESTLTQALFFPRTIDLDKDGTGSYIIPYIIEDATYEQAYWLLKQQDSPDLLNRRELQAQGVAALSLDGVSETYGSSLLPGFGAVAASLLQRYMKRSITIAPRW